MVVDSKINKLNHQFVYLGRDFYMVAEGGAAATAYARLQFEDTNDNTRKKITTALLRYRKLDTLAMAMITRAWLQI